jgi:hypothetical protein
VTLGASTTVGGRDRWGQVRGEYVDADLFRRLRLRGEARGGAEGRADPCQALRLVSGTPFDQLREDGWTWLFEGDRIDHHLLVAIIDVAHLVITQALTDGDLTRARAATDIALRVAPGDDPVLLDLAQITAAEGHQQEAERILREDIRDRWDDGEPPLDLSPRTEEILRAWARDRTAS